MEKKERRRYRRTKKQFVGKFQLRSHEASEWLSARWNMVTIQNMGAGGALFNYDKEIEVGSLLDMQIRFPMVESPIVCLAKVLRVEDIPNFSLFAIAISFGEMEDKGQEAIDAFIEGLYSRELKQHWA